MHLLGGVFCPRYLWCWYCSSVLPLSFLFDSLPLSFLLSSFFQVLIAFINSILCVSHLIRDSNVASLVPCKLVNIDFIKRMRNLGKTFLSTLSKVS